MLPVLPLPASDAVKTTRFEASRSSEPLDKIHNSAYFIGRNFGLFFYPNICNVEYENNHL